MKNWMGVLGVRTDAGHTGGGPHRLLEVPDGLCVIERPAPWPLVVPIELASPRTVQVGEVSGVAGVGALVLVSGRVDLDKLADAGRRVAADHLRCGASILIEPRFERAVVDGYPGWQIRNAAVLEDDDGPRPAVRISLVKSART